MVLDLFVGNFTTSKKLTINSMIFMPCASNMETLFFPFIWIIYA